MIADNIKRVEEARYLLSKKTFDLMKAKLIRGIPTNLNPSELQSEIEILKGEIAKHLSVIQDAGYVYIFVNKNEIEKLKNDFLNLSQEEKINAFKGVGRGYEILSRSNSLLKKNYDSKEDIATLIISLPGDDKVVQTIKNYLEGVSDRGMFKLESHLAASRISSLISSLGFESYQSGENVYLGKDILSAKQAEVKEEIVNSVFPTQVMTPRAEESEHHQSSVQKEMESIIVNEELKEIEEADEIKATDMKSIGSSDVVPSEEDAEYGSSKLSSEDLQPTLTYSEVCQKIDEIMNNYKMKRWVLGAFKDENEKKQYEKIQSLLIKLIRLKNSMEEKGTK